MTCIPTMNVFKVIKIFFSKKKILSILPWMLFTYRLVYIVCLSFRFDAFCLFLTPWWSPFICPLRAEKRLRLLTVSAIFLTATFQEETLVRSNETTDIHLIFWVTPTIFPRKCAGRWGEQQYSCSKTAAKSSTVGLFIYCFKLLTFPSSLTHTRPLTLLLPFPCFLFYMLLLF